MNCENCKYTENNRKLIISTLDRPAIASIITLYKISGGSRGLRWSLLIHCFKLKKKKKRKLFFKIFFNWYILLYHYFILNSTIFTKTTLHYIYLLKTYFTFPRFKKWVWQTKFLHPNKDWGNLPLPFSLGGR